MLRGNYYFAEKQYGTALEDYKRALDLDPTLAAASTNLANCHDLVKQVKTTARTDEGARPAPAVSKAELKEVADSDARTLRTKGYEALKAGRDQFALLALNRSVQLEPNSALGRRYLAHALIATGDGTGAIQQFYNWEKLETVSATDAIAFARLLARAGDLSNAQLLFQHIISKHSTDTKSHAHGC